MYAFIACSFYLFEVLSVDNVSNDSINLHRALGEGELHVVEKPANFSAKKNACMFFGFYFIKISRSEAYIFISQELSLSLVRVMNCVTGIVCSSLTPSCRIGSILSC